MSSLAIDPNDNDDPNRKPTLPSNFRAISKPIEKPFTATNNVMNPPMYLFRQQDKVISPPPAVIYML